jgi:diguanylate cyclase (GGDEF)-like protein
MSILLPTLFVFNTLVYALLGLFMYFIWHEDKEKEFRWWSLGFFLNCGALLLFACRDIAEFPSIMVGNALTLWGLGAIWTGVRVFAERPISRAPALAGGLIWIAAFSHATPLIRLDGRTTLVAIYAFLIASELYSYNKERLPVARATAALVAIHGGLNAIVGLSAQFMSVEAPASVYDIPIAKFMAAEAMSYGIILGFMLLALSKARAAARQKAAALTDPLTGLANRRAFDHAAERVIKESRGNETPALLVFDLDRFKTINDRFGHAEGDRALRVFAEVAARNIRADGVLARVGGEEFAAMLIAEPSTALAIAERIRSAFAREAGSIADGLVSVSVGVAVMQNKTPDLARLMNAADEALYMAKAAGRNQVFFSPDIAGAAPRAGGNRPDVVLQPLNAA